MTIAAIIAMVLLGIIVIFQAGLALGVPWGAAAWGGQNPGVLPTRLRVASGITALVIYPLIALVILAAAGIIDDAWLPVDRGIALWVLAGFLALGALLNLVSRSPLERIWGPVALAIAICCAIIALASTPG